VRNIYLFNLMELIYEQNFSSCIDGGFIRMCLN
jgi:hypothetical protein